MGQMADQAAILEEELKRVGFSDSLREKMVLAWWSALISSAFIPNLGDILGQMIDKEDE